MGSCDWARRNAVVQVRRWSHSHLGCLRLSRPSNPALVRSSDDDENDGDAVFAASQKHLRNIRLPGWSHYSAIDARSATRVGYIVMLTPFAAQPAGQPVPRHQRLSAYDYTRCCISKQNNRATAFTFMLGNHFTWGIIFVCIAGDIERIRPTSCLGECQQATYELRTYTVQVG